MMLGFTLPTPKGYISPDTLLTNPTPWDDEFDDVTLNPRWTSFGTNLTLTLGNSCIRMSTPSVGDRLKGILQPITGTSWKFRTHYRIENAANNFNAFGFVVKNAANGRFVSLVTMFHSSHGYYCPYIGTFSAYNAPVGEIVSDTWILTSDIYLELEYTAAGALILRTSHSGYFYFPTTNSTTSGAYLLADPTHIGLIMDNQGAAQNVAFDWIRRVG